MMRNDANMAANGVFCYTENVSKNLRAYLKMDLSRFENRYAVLVDGKLVGTGKDLPRLLRAAKKKYPTKTPAVTKIPGHQTLVLRSHDRHYV